MSEDALALQWLVRQRVENNLSEKTRKQYLAKVKVLTRMIYQIRHLRDSSIELDEHDQPKMHTGGASEIYVLKLPISEEVVNTVFAMISIDESLVKKKKVALSRDDGSRAGGAASSIDSNNVDDGDDDREYVENTVDEAVDAVFEYGSRESDSGGDVASFIRSHFDSSKERRTVSAQTYQNYRSALIWWHLYDCEEYSKVRCPFPEAIKASLAQLVAGYKRSVGEKKRKGVMAVKDGKRPYSFFGYKEICKAFYALEPSGKQYRWEEGMFGGLFTKLSVNSIGRSDNIDDLLLKNIDWDVDALSIAFGTSKSDQTGERYRFGKAIYANPFLPEICCVLHLAIYTWITPRTNAAEFVRLFNGTEQNKRYYSILRSVVDTVIPQSIQLGCKRDEIGTHSNRKFAESTSVSRMGGPSRTQVALRAGQSAGKTQDCYFFQEEEGDTFVGRTVAQLTMTADQFDVLPPHFLPSTLEYLSDIWPSVLDNYALYPPSFQRVIPFLLASLVYHHSKGNLARLLPAQHPLFQCRLFTQPTLLNYLTDKVDLKFAYCEESAIYARGVPQNVILQREVRLLRTDYQVLMNNMMAEVRQIPAVVRSIVDSANPSYNAAANFSETVQVALNRMEAFMTRLQSDSTATSVASNSATGGGNGTGNAIPSHQPFLYNGQFHFVPQGFTFPSYSLHVIWDLWFFGKMSENIGPYRHISPRHDLPSKNCRINFCRAKFVMNVMIYFAIKEKVIARDQDINAGNSDAAYKAGYENIMECVYGEIPSRGQAKYVNTIYFRWKEMEKDFNES